MRKKYFFLFLVSDFFRIWAKYFQNFGQKTSKTCENYLLRVQRNNLWLEIFFKSFAALWIFYRNLWHGSQNSVYVSRVKCAEKIVFFLFSFQKFFGFWAKTFRLLAKKTSRICQNYLLHVQRDNLWLDFSKVLNRFGFSAETFGMVLEILSTCPE